MKHDIMRRSYKYRIYPSRSQEKTIENHFSMCRALYNWCLRERIDFYKSKNASLSLFHQSMYLPMLKTDRPWFKLVCAQSLQDVLRRLDRAYDNFFRRVKSGAEEKGFPKFKKYGKWNSITYPQFYKRPSNKIEIPKIGKVKAVIHREVPDTANIKTLTVAREGAKWFACYSVELPLDIESCHGLPAIGIDLGLIDFAYDSTGHSVAAGKHLKEHEKKLKKVQGRLSKAKKRTKEYLKCLKMLQACHYRVKCHRNDFLHKTANKFLEKADTIFYEDLTIKKMIKRPAPIKDEATDKFLPNGAIAKSGLNKAIADAGWGRFIDIMKYKAEKLGKTVIAVPPQYTSQKCSRCGAMVKKALSVRTHECKCGFVANRDYNAACNILGIGMDALEAKAS